MRLLLQDNLPFVTVTLAHRGREIEIPNVLIDTGSGGTLFSANAAAEIGITPQGEDVLRRIHGVGGSEVVFMRKIDSIRVGDFSLRDFDIEVGGMDYCFDIRGILGMDFLLAAGAQMDFKQLTIEFT